MDITFLVGNGFDIGIGLHTKYSNFYEVYCKENEKDNDNIKKFKQTLKNCERKSNQEERIIDWSDFEKAFGQHSNDFDKGEANLYLEQFENFLISFNKYLEEEEQNADLSNKDKITKKMNNAINSYYDIREEDKEYILREVARFNGNRTFNFISFNYTKTLDQCVGYLKESFSNNSSVEIINPIHIHGYIQENMIMGVNDETQISNPIFAKDNEVFHELIKSHQNSDSRTNYESRFINKIEHSDIICIYGMSIGETDKKWWTYIGDWLVKDEHHCLIILTHDDDYNERFPYVQRRVTTRIMKKFLNLTDLEDNVKNDVKSRIFMGINHDIFAMNLRKKKHIEENENTTDKPSALGFIPNNYMNSEPNFDLNLSRINLARAIYYANKKNNFVDFSNMPFTFDLNTENNLYNNNLLNDRYNLLENKKDSKILEPQ